MGARAWTERVVPQYVTTNPVMADAYARLLLAYERDARAAGWLAPGVPLHVVELGAGSGELAHHLLRRVRALGGAGRVRYVLTDISEKTLGAWERHPRLTPWFASGAADVALFDAERDDRLALRRAARVLAPGRLDGPLAVVANYVLDGLPQDAFRVGLDGGLEELLVAAEVDGQDLASVGLSLAAVTAPAAPYGDPELDGLLRLPDRPAAFTFPVTALRCLRRLAALPAGGRLALLAADRGDHRPAVIEESGVCDLARHGSVSMLVNFHALGAWFTGRGGRALLPDAGPEHLDVGCFLLGGGGAPETERTFREAVSGSGPDDFFSLKLALDAARDGLTLGQALAFLRLSGWDAHVFRRLAVVLQRADATPGQALEVERGAERLLDGFFPLADDLADERQLALELAVVVHAAGRDEAALRLLARAGDGPETDRWRSACLRRLGRA